MSSNPADISTETPLRYFHKLSSHQTDSQNAELFNGDVDFGLVVKEAPLCAHLNLRGSAQDQSFVAGIEEVLGIELPTEPGTYHCNQQQAIYWLGPDEWVLVSQSSAAELEAELRQALSGHISIVDISGGQTVINLRGAQSAVQTLLKKSSVYDFAAWPQAEKNAGRCAQTTFAKASAVISNKSDGSFDLIVRRSFADYIARWLLDAGQEFGCRIEG
jgi:sarcosine oxidase subunit gamma